MLQILMGNSFHFKCSKELTRLEIKWSIYLSMSNSDLKLGIEFKNVITLEEKLRVRDLLNKN